jgi:hypothetical protein
MHLQNKGLASRDHNEHQDLQRRTRSQTTRLKLKTAKKATSTKTKVIIGKNKATIRNCKITIKDHNQHLQGHARS